MDELKIILDRIRKPLTFATRDNFAHLKSLAALETFMHTQIEDLKRVAKDRHEISEIVQLFVGFDALSLAQKKARIIAAMAVIESFDKNQKTSDGLHTPADIPPHPPIETFEGRPGPIRQAQGRPLPPGERVSSVSPSSSGGEKRENGSINLQHDTPVQYCKGIGPKRSEMLQKLGITTVDDALMHLPWRYEDRGNLKKISRLTYGSFETVSGEVVSSDVVQTRRQRVKVFELVVTDKTGMLVGSWYNQPFMKKMFRQGQRVILSGVVKSNPYRSGLPQMDNPEFEIMGEDEGDDMIHAGRIVPIYRATSGLSVRAIRTMIKTILDSCAGSVREALPEFLIRK